MKIIFSKKFIDPNDVTNKILVKFKNSLQVSNARGNGEANLAKALQAGLRLNNVMPFQGAEERDQFSRLGSWDKIELMRRFILTKLFAKKSNDYLGYFILLKEFYNEELYQFICNAILVNFSKNIKMMGVVSQNLNFLDERLKLNITLSNLSLYYNDKRIPLAGEIEMCLQFTPSNVELIELAVSTKLLYKLSTQEQVMVELPDLSDLMISDQDKQEQLVQFNSILRDHFIVGGECFDGISLSALAKQEIEWEKVYKAQKKAREISAKKTQNAFTHQATATKNNMPSVRPHSVFVARAFPLAKDPCFPASPETKKKEIFSNTI